MKKGTELEKQNNKTMKNRQKKINSKNKKIGYILLYLFVIVVIIIGEVILFKFAPDTTIWDLLKDTVGNLMGVMAAFLLFDIAHEWISKDTYASEVSEQILDTLMYHPEAMELYENDQKKVFVNAFIGSIVHDADMSDMIRNYLNSYLLTEKDLQDMTHLAEKDCRIRTAFSYRFVLETERTGAFVGLQAPREKDPYFYVQEELNYHVKYIAERGNNTEKRFVKISFVYDNAQLDRFLRGNSNGDDKEILRNCIFRENLDIEQVDKDYFGSMKDDPDKLLSAVKKMFRPHLTIDRYHGRLEKVEVGTYEGKDYGIIVTFEVDHDIHAREHDIDIIFHMPKKWNSILEVALVEPTKDPQISISYNEDMMDVDMYPFLNRGDASAYANTYENENGVYRISLSNEWVFPISGVIFHVKRDAKNNCEVNGTDGENGR